MRLLAAAVLAAFCLLEFDFAKADACETPEAMIGRVVSAYPTAHVTPLTGAVGTEFIKRLNAAVSVPVDADSAVLFRRDGTDTALLLAFKNGCMVRRGEISSRMLNGVLGEQS